MSANQSIREEFPFDIDLQTRPVASTIEQGVGYILMNMPETKNALSTDMVAKIAEKLADYKDDKTVRVIAICAMGNVFSAGHDLRELDDQRTQADKGSAYFKAAMRQSADLMLNITACPKPVLAVIDGLATAAGCQLVASCDLAIASSTSKFATPGVNIGLFCSTPMVALSRNVGRKQAMSMLLLGEAVDAETAQSFGLVNKVAAPTQLWAEVAKMTAILCEKAAITLSRGLSAFYEQAEMSVEDAYDFAINVMVDNMLDKDATEGVDAFLNKKPPDWSKITEGTDGADTSDARNTPDTE